MGDRRTAKPRVIINYNLNRNIRATNIMVIDSNGQQLGIKSKDEALSLAESQGLDLYLVSPPNATQPVAKILDYGKLKYEQTKKHRQLKQKQTQTINKQIRLRAGISEHDMAVKVKKTRGFLIAKNRVKVSLRFRGREVTHSELGHAKLQQFFKAVEDIAAMENKIEKSGMFLNMFLVPLSPKAKLKFKKENQNAKNENKVSIDKKS